MAPLIFIFMFSNLMLCLLFRQTPEWSLSAPEILLFILMPSSLRMSSPDEVLRFSVIGVLDGLSTDPDETFPSIVTVISGITLSSLSMAAAVISMPKGIVFTQSNVTTALLIS